jgi:hypothetical protein
MNAVSTLAPLDSVQTACSMARPKQEQFAQHFAAHGNATAAYRAAFDCAGMLPGTVHRRAYELAHDPAVAARVRELLAAAAEGAIVDARSRMVRLQSIVNADPSELVRVTAEPCRHCHGISGAYQWARSGRMGGGRSEGDRRARADP